MASTEGESAGRNPNSDHERQLFEALAEYFEAVESGQAPVRHEWLARFPDLADEINGFLDDQDRLLKLTEPLRPSADDVASDDQLSCPTLVLNDPSADDGILSLPPTEPANRLDHDLTTTRVRYVGDYELLGEIARGGMGVVFLARQRSLNRPVAVKMLLAGTLMTKADEQRFRQEAEAAANLDHPNIVPIFEVGRHDGHCYFSMKLVEGGSLSQRLRDFANDQRAGARLLAMVARAVHHAHQRGVLHRDLKPSNILLSGGPATPIDQLEPHVTDFGLAKRIEGDSELTHSGAILGTPSYMAPEQALGKKGVVTVATDVYGLGAILYAVLAGRPPFQGESVLETIAQVKDRVLDPPSSHGRRIDRDLETICLKCLEKEPRRRYGSAEAVAEDLERWLTDVPILARPSGRAEHAWRWCRRNPAAAALSVAVVALLIAAVTGVIVNSRRIAREQVEAASRARETRRDNYVRDVKRAGELLEENRRGPAIDLLAEYLSKPGEDDLRDFAWHYQWRMAHLGGQPLRGHTGEVYHADFSPDGKTLATAGHDRTIRVWDVAERRARLIIAGHPASPDGHADEINWVTFSPDGKSLATASDDQTIKLWDVATGRLRAAFKGQTDQQVAALFTPDGLHVVSSGRQGKVVLWDTATSRERGAFHVSNGTIQSLALSPDGAMLAIAGDRVVIWDLTGGRQMLTFDGLGGQVNTVAFSPDGTTLALGTKGGGVRLWTFHDRKVAAIDGGHKTGVESVVFAPDVSTLVSADSYGVLRVLDWSSGAYETIATGQERIWCVACSVDGHTLATTSRDGSVRLWDLSRDRTRASVAKYRSKIVRGDTLAFAPDGKSLAIVSNYSNVWTYDLAQDRRAALRRFDASGPVQASALSADMAVFATVGSDRSLRTWNFQDPGRGPNVVSLPEYRGDLWISQAGKRLAWVNNNGVSRRLIVREISNGSEMAFDGLDPRDVVFCAHEDRLAVSSFSDPTPSLCDLTTGRSRRLAGLGHRGGSTSLTIAPDGQILAAGEADGSIMLWDCRSLAEVARLKGHTGVVTSLAFSPTGQILASGGTDRTVRLWNVAARKEITTLKEIPGATDSIVFSPDGLRLAAAVTISEQESELFLWRPSQRE